MNAFVHLHDEGKANWDNRTVEMATLPRIGEHMAFAWNDEHWYEVESVVRCYFDAEYQAEIFAKKVKAFGQVHESIRNDS